jgi:hypothetical protein
MPTKIFQQVLTGIRADKIIKIEDIQSLWSNYGKILRLHTNSRDYPTIIAKHIYPPDKFDHPRGWNTNTSHNRKIKSYEIETSFYRNYEKKCNQSKKCIIPKLIKSIKTDSETVLFLEDLDSIGFHIRKKELKLEEAKPCIKWLANFHATFYHQTPKQLWGEGTYWHLETRQEELNSIKDTNLKSIAPLIAKKLRDTNYKTFVHGDAKLQNFCFSDINNSVASVDFQYVGAGCGMKDLAYFIGSVFDENDCEIYENEILDTYFHELFLAFRDKKLNLNSKHIELCWRKLYPYAWADFHRFLMGWQPGHWKLNNYTQKMLDIVTIDLNRTF